MKENFQVTEVILHVDYSESYSNTQQNEIQVYTLETQRLVYLQFAVTFLTIGKSSLNVLLLLLANAVITSRNTALTCVDMVFKKN